MNPFMVVPLVGAICLLVAWAVMCVRWGAGPDLLIARKRFPFTPEELTEQERRRALNAIVQAQQEQREQFIHRTARRIQ